MKQSSLDLNLSTRKTRKQELLAQMDRVVPWAALVVLIAPYYPEGKNGRPPFALETMLRIHCMQQWFTLSDLAMEEAFFDTPIYREFAQLDAHGRIPDESTILSFRHRLEKHKLADQILATVNDLLAAQGIQTSYMRIRSLPFSEDVRAFLEDFERIYVVELNRDGQMKQLLTMYFSEYGSKLRQVSHLDGMPLTARWVFERITTIEEAN